MLVAHLHAHRISGSSSIPSPRLPSRSPQGCGGRGHEEERVQTIPHGASFSAILFNLFSTMTRFRIYSGYCIEEKRNIDMTTTYITNSIDPRHLPTT
ncbi:hypothetical protein E2C01_079951 [Portunus trituberculatus]|uniref:Uncharacterized protein n=1 Tax=Portunus trituberculatus TaxID=210409 RepID=A0A5B7IWZ0_PORTR|nr:hypothetical protein [Portunus trituberculatus]